MGNVMLETRDLILHQGSAEDGRELYQNLWSKRAAFRFLFSSPCADVEAGMRRTAELVAANYRSGTGFFVYERASGRAIGVAAIAQTEPNIWEVTELAIGPGYQRQGYGRQALLALAELAFTRMGAEELCCACFVENTAAKELLMACGFSFSHTGAATQRKGRKAVWLEHYGMDLPRPQTCFEARAILRRGGKILLVKRRQEPYKGRWDLPGGEIRMGEDAGEALQRALLESHGLCLKTAELVKTIQNRETYFSNQGQAQRTTFISLVHEVQVEEGETGGSGRIPTGEDMPETEWFSTKEMQKLFLTPYAAFAKGDFTYELIRYEEKYRDDMIFMVLEAKNALGRVPRLNEDLLDIPRNYPEDRGEAFWLAVDDKDRVIGCMGFHLTDDHEEGRLQRLYVKPTLKRRGIGSALLDIVEVNMLEEGVQFAYVHLGGEEYWESKLFYAHHGYEPYGQDMLRKELEDEIDWNACK